MTRRAPRRTVALCSVAAAALSQTAAIQATLLSRGAQADYQNGFGKTALYYAIELNDLPLVELLLSSEADVNHRYKDPPGKDDYMAQCAYDISQWRRTPLMHAAQYAGPEMIRLLLSHGARTGDADSQEQTALDYASSSGRAENAAVLKSATNDQESKRKRGLMERDNPAH